MHIGGSNFRYSLNQNLKKKSNIEDYLYLNGRMAFKSILNKLKKRRKRKIFIPNYICESLIDVIDKKKFNINFYNVRNNFEIELPNTKNEIILIINFFGIKYKIPNKLKKDNIIVEDITFSFLLNDKISIKKRKNYYFFGSLRKFFNSYAIGISNLKNKNKKKSSATLDDYYFKCLAASMLREEYLKRKNYIFNDEIENHYLKVFKQFESFFDDNHINFDNQNIIRTSNFKNNYVKERKIYKRNINILKKNVNKKIIFITKKYKELLIIPIFSTKKLFLIKYMKSHNIYFSNFWKTPKELIKKKLSHNLYEELILIPNDIDAKPSSLKLMSKIINFYYKKYES